MHSAPKRGERRGGVDARRRDPPQSRPTLAAGRVDNLYDGCGESSRPGRHPCGTAIVHSRPGPQKGGTEMTRLMTGVVAAGALVALTCTARPARAADDACFYKGTMYSHGATACQSGKQYKCDDGEWRARDGACQESQAKASKPCDFDGIAFSSGAASCQDGTQYRCEDGTWRRLGKTCPVADAPTRALPSGRTCMFDGATVSNGSAICRSGTT